MWILRSLMPLTTFYFWLGICTTFTSLLTQVISLVYCSHTPYNISSKITPYIVIEQYNCSNAWLFFLSVLTYPLTPFKLHITHFLCCPENWYLIFFILIPFLALAVNSERKYFFLSLLLKQGWDDLIHSPAHTLNFNNFLMFITYSNIEANNMANEITLKKCGI